MVVNSEEEEVSLRNRAFKIISCDVVDESNCPATRVHGMTSVMGNNKRSQVVLG